MITSKFHRLLPFTLIISIGFACKETKKSDPSSTDKEYNLQLSFKPNDTLHYSSTMYTVMEYSAGPLPKMVASTDMSIGADITAISPFPEQRQLSLSYSEWKQADKFDGMGLYNSTDKPDSTLGEKIIGIPLMIDIGAKNEINPQLMDPNFFPTYDDLSTTNTVTRMFSKRQINIFFGLPIQLFPGKPVKVGDKWRNEREILIGGWVLPAKETYELLSVKDSVAQVEIEGGYNDTPLNLQLVLSPIEGRSVEGTYSGQLHININNGHLITGEIKFTGEIIDDSKSIMKGKLTATYRVIGE